MRILVVYYKHTRSKHYQSIIRRSSITFVMLCNTIDWTCRQLYQDNTASHSSSRVKVSCSYKHFLIILKVKFRTFLIWFPVIFCFSQSWKLLVKGPDYVENENPTRVKSISSNLFSFSLYTEDLLIVLFRCYGLVCT